MSATEQRTAAERRVVRELEAWRAHAIPDRSTPLDTDALAHLVRACVAAMAIDPAVTADFSVNTVHYYRRKNILDAPAGRTSAARYGVRHLWQAVGARLAGHLGLVTLAEAREAMQGADEETLLAFVAARVVDARARQALRERAPAPAPAAVAASLPEAPATRARPLPGVHASARVPTPPVVIPLPDEAWCILPASHPSLRSPRSARELVDALATALGVSSR
jgi:hypothetical protein